MNQGATAACPAKRSEQGLSCPLSFQILRRFALRRRARDKDLSTSGASLMFFWNPGPMPSQAFFRGQGFRVAQRFSAAIKALR